MLRFVAVIGVSAVLLGLTPAQADAPVGQDGVVLYSTDGGQSWKRALTKDFRLMRSTNGGKTFTVLDVPLQEGLPESDIYKWLSEVDLPATRWRNDKRWQVSQQRKLENALRQMNAIDRASVMITPATTSHQSLGTAGGRPRATVNVRLKPGIDLDTKVASAIAAMLKGAVPMLKREDVTVIDDSTSLMIPIPEEK